MLSHSEHRAREATPSHSQSFGLHLSSFAIKLKLGNGRPDPMTHMKQKTFRLKTIGGKKCANYVFFFSSLFLLIEFGILTKKVDFQESICCGSYSLS